MKITQNCLSFKLFFHLFLLLMFHLFHPFCVNRCKSHVRFTKFNLLALKYFLKYSLISFKPLNYLSHWSSLTSGWMSDNWFTLNLSHFTQCEQICIREPNASLCSTSPRVPPKCQQDKIKLKDHMHLTCVVSRCFSDVGTEECVVKLAGLQVTHRHLRLNYTTATATASGHAVASTDSFWFIVPQGLRVLQSNSLPEH